MAIEVETTCSEIMSKVLKISPSQCKDEMFEYSTSWDSLKHMELISELETAFALELEEDEMVRMTTFESIVSVVTARIS